MSDLSTWREAVRSAALAAAIKETIQEACSQAAMTGSPEWSENGIPFNYRWEHVQAVVRLAVRLAELTDADREVVEAAAWLHDVAKGRSKDHGKDGATAARRILSETDFPPGKIDKVADAIVKHRGLWVTEPVEPLEAAVLWDADKLSKLGATAVLHFAGGLVTYGLVPRVLLLGLCLRLLTRARRRWRLDTNRPGYLRLQPGLMPQTESLGVIDPDTPGEDEADAPAPPGPRRKSTAGAPAVLGLEIDAPTSPWPPRVSGVSWRDLGLVDGRQDRNRVLEQLAEPDAGPSTVVVVCGLTTTPRPSVA